MNLRALLGLIVAATAVSAGCRDSRLACHFVNFLTASPALPPKARPPINISPSNSVLWKVPVPWSPSSPCIWDDQIFLTTYSNGELQTRCYRRHDGSLAWTRGLKPDKLELLSHHREQSRHPHPRDRRPKAGHLLRLLRTHLLRSLRSGAVASSVADGPGAAANMARHAAL